MTSKATRAVLDNEEIREAIGNQDRILEMRWILTWKVVDPPAVPKEGEPTTVSKDGTRKAKARLVVLGYQHPDLVRRDEAGQAILETVSSTISKQAKHMMSQSAAIHRWTIESADAASAFFFTSRTNRSRAKTVDIRRARTGECLSSKPK